MAKKIQDYCVGLDIGTNSVGWAAIDGEYNLLKLKNKDAWGAFLFEPAQTAKNTRIFRGQRRRYERRKERIRLLQELLYLMVAAKDEGFFARLKESSLRMGEGDYFRLNRYNLFDGEYTDRDYFRGANTRTIYHLRKYLMTTEDKADERLIYLAIHHIIKYRGNFLYEGKAFESGGGLLKEEIKKLFEILLYEHEKDFRYTERIENVTEILQDKRLSRSAKKDKIVEIFADSEEKDFIKAFSAAVVGNKASLSDIVFSQEEIKDENDKAVKFSFADSKYEEQEDGLIALCGEYEDVFLALKAIYMSILFEDVMQGAATISEAMINRFEKHKKDLKILKGLIKQYLPKQYSAFFRKEKGVNYVNYVGSKTKKYGRYEKKVGEEEFYQKVKALLAEMPDSEEKAYCLKEIDLGDFLPKLNSVRNAAIPYQMQEAELKAIIDNQGKYYPVLKENKEKILSLLTFRRPYYVGPLKGKHSWAEKEIEGRVTPWNFYEKVDTDAFAENFITRMTNKCKIFPEEEALPKNSVLYQAYGVLNEINKIKFKGKNLPKEWKEDIFLNLCCVRKKVTVKNIKDRLGKTFNVEIGEGELKGLSDETLTSSMATLIDFKNKLKDNFDRQKIDSYEEAIRILTIFDDLNIRRKRIKELKCFTPSEIEAIIRLKYTKWGSFSRKALHGVVGSNGKTVLETMYDTDKHFNEIIFDEALGFKDMFRREEETITKFRHADVEELYCSPVVKKGIWNALKIVEEISKVAGKDPARIFLESTAGEEEKKKKDSRTQRLKKLYDEIKNETYFEKDCYAELKRLESEKKTIDSDKLYLWLIQLGRCMYSGESISFDKVGECEIDHIVPRAYITDDSFENRVLVKKIENQKKSDTLTLRPDIRKNMYEFWKFLYDKKFIGTKKFTNLQKSEYGDDEKVGFINRQLVETSQTVKEVKKLLQRRYPDAVIECVKAGLNSQFRRKYREQGKAGFYKIRTLNNFHHAKDAYLTAVVGQFTTVACPMWGQEHRNIALKYYIKNSDKAHDDVKTLINKRYGIILDLMQYADNDKIAIDDEGEYLWDNTRYGNVFATMEKNNCLVVKQKSFMAESQFYDQTIYGPDSGKKDLIPLKNTNGIPMPSAVYGGYSSEKPAYFVILAKQKKKGKGFVTEYVFDNVPVRILYAEKNKPGAIREYFEKEYGEGVRIVRNIYKYQKIVMNGQKCFVTGTLEQNNATELYVKAKYEKLLYLSERDRLVKEWEDSFDGLIKEFIDDYSFIVRKTMPLYANFADKLQEIKEKYFDEMSIVRKADLLKRMLIVSNTRSKDLKLDDNLGGGKFGRLNKTILKQNLVLMDESVTGLYVSEWKVI